MTSSVALQLAVCAHNPFPPPSLLYSTWFEFSSSMNGIMLHKLVGPSDDEKLMNLCNTIEEQVQKLRPFQPIAKSRFISNLYCRQHNGAVTEICPGAHSILLLGVCSYLTSVSFGFRSRSFAVQRLYLRSHLRLQHPGGETCRHHRKVGLRSQVPRNTPKRVQPHPSQHPE